MRTLFTLLLAPLLLYGCQTRTAEGKDENADLANATADKAAEFADPKFTEIGRRHMIMFENGNIQGWAEMFADNAVLVWSGGDSLVGKKAITDYWVNRRANVIDSIDISNEIWLPVKVNKSQQGEDLPGVWLLSWHQFNTKYRNGKTLAGWVHSDYHFNENDKVDRWVQYLDRGPIETTGGSK